MKDTFERFFLYSVVLLLASALILLVILILSLAFMDTDSINLIFNEIGFNFFPFLLMVITLCMALVFIIDFFVKKEIKERQYCPVCDKNTSKNEKGECNTCGEKVRFKGKVENE